MSGIGDPRIGAVLIFLDVGVRVAVRVTIRVVKIRPYKVVPLPEIRHAIGVRIRTVRIGVQESQFKVIPNPVTVRIDIGGIRRIVVRVVTIYFIVVTQSVAINYVEATYTERTVETFGRVRSRDQNGTPTALSGVLVDDSGRIDFGPDETVTISNSGAGILSVQFEGGSGDLYLDNIQVSQVPVPAAAWLFGSALGGLGWMRRRKTA